MISSAQNKFKIYNTIILLCFVIPLSDLSFNINTALSKSCPYVNAPIVFQIFETLSFIIPEFIIPGNMPGFKAAH